MPRTTRTFEKAEQDREVDELWRHIDALEAALKGLPKAAAGPSAQAVQLSDPPTKTFTVQDETGSPVLEVTGLIFPAADGFTLSEETGLAVVDVMAGMGVSVEVSGGAEVGPKSILNLIPGTNISSITAAAAGTDIDVTINAATQAGSGVSAEVSGGTEYGPASMLNFIPGTNIDSIVAALTGGTDLDITINAATQNGPPGGSTIMGQYTAGPSPAVGILNIFIQHNSGAAASATLPPLGVASEVAFMYVYHSLLTGANALVIHCDGSDNIDGAATVSMGPGTSAIFIGISGAGTNNKWNRIL